MKDYAPGNWGLAFIFSLEGSVFPKAFICAFPNACLSVALWYIFRDLMADQIFKDALSGVTVSQAWSTYNWVIGFMVAYRAQRAYSRWWEGGTLLQQARGEWFNAYSSLIAFCTQDQAKLELVRKFQQTISRLTSMLYASALMSIATESDLDFEIIDATGLSDVHLEYLRTQPDKCEIIMQWIQRLIVDNMQNGVLPIPPPVISRVFQELSRGIVNIHNVRKITEFQFPFPAAQMIVTMLIVQWMLTPVVAALLMGTPVWAFIVAFCPIFACWGINYIAGEIEQPFGTDYNDMPMHFMQASMNTSILSLLDDHAQTPPDFDMEQDNAQEVIAAGAKAPGDNKMFKFDKMRSVRCVTIQDPEQLNRVKHRFTQGRLHSRASTAHTISRNKMSQATRMFWLESTSRVSLESASASVVPVRPKVLSERHKPREQQSVSKIRTSGETVNVQSSKTTEEDMTGQSSQVSSLTGGDTDTRDARVRFGSSSIEVVGKDKTSSAPSPPQVGVAIRQPPEDVPGIITLHA